jgi:hypothetical protein
MEPLQTKSNRLVNAYFSCNGVRPYNGTIVEVGALGTPNRWGDIVSVDIWPLGGFGVSPIGGRIKVLPLEAGFGTLGYEPKPEGYPKKEEKERLPDKRKRPDSEEDQFLFVDGELYSNILRL